MIVRTPQARSPIRRLGTCALQGAIHIAGMGTASRPAPDREAEPQRIVVLAFWGIGDAIHLIPMLRMLKQRYPGAELEVIGQGHLKALFRSEPAVDRITQFAPPWTASRGKYRIWRPAYRKMWRWLRTRRRNPDDWILCSRADPRDHLVAAWMGGGRRFGFGAAGGASLLTDDFGVVPPLARGLHSVEAAIEVAQHLGCRTPAEAPELVLEEGECAAVCEVLDREGLGRRGPLLAVHVGTSFSIRRWPAERFSETLAEVRDEIGEVILIADPGGEWRSVEIPEGLPSHVFRADLRGVLALLGRADALLCSDSGIMHAAAALQTPVVAAFGPTSKEWFGPYGNNHHVVRAESIECGPCVDRCQRGSPVCMDALGARQVAHALRGCLRELRSVPESIRSAELTTVSA